MDWLWVLITLARHASPEPEDQWAARLTALDSARQRAFAEAAPQLLDSVYVADSRALAHDVDLIRSYARRGGRVTGAELRILSCTVISSGRDQARLEIVDVLAPSQVVWRDGMTSELPHDRPSQRIVTMRRTADGWRIAGLQDVVR